MYRPEKRLPIIHVQAKAPAGVMPLEAWPPMALPCEWVAGDSLTG